MIIATLSRFVFDFFGKILLRKLLVAQLANPHAIYIFSLLPPPSSSVCVHIIGRGLNAGCLPPAYKGGGGMRVAQREEEEEGPSPVWSAPLEVSGGRGEGLLFSL